MWYKEIEPTTDSIEKGEVGMRLSLPRIHGISVEFSKEVLRQFVLIHMSVYGSVSRNPQKTFVNLLDEAYLGHPTRSTSKVLKFKEWTFFVEQMNDCVAVGRVRHTGYNETNDSCDGTTPDFDTDREIYEKLDDTMEITFRGLKTYITDHALERFIERLSFNDRELAYSPIRNLKKLFLESQPEKIRDDVKVRRIISNKFVLAEYYSYENLRFVIVEEDGYNILVTVERKNVHK